MIIKLVRHGQSQSNVGEVDATWYGDHLVSLTLEGEAQADAAGAEIGPDFVDGALAYQSPYRRTRQTMSLLILGAGRSVRRIYDDPRLREVEWGFNQPEDHGEFVDGMRDTHGRFYYRMDGGESPADCFDRISTFLETMMRQVERKKADRILIVSHGTTIRTFVMRFMHLTVEDYENMRNPRNCDIITVTDEGCDDAQFRTSKWAASGLRLRDKGESRSTTTGTRPVA